MVRSLFENIVLLYRLKMYSDTYIYICKNESTKLQVPGYFILNDVNILTVDTD